ncbi:MAG: phosphate ABC transporter permease PstA [Armatimonadetes bacterium]|nr:phosphate ABC transporter permease PstA [Armatimonadota bacterium]
MRYETVRRVTNVASLAFCGLLAATAVLPLVLVLYHVVRNGASALNLDFFTKLPVPIGESGGGMANALVGSLLLIGAASLVGVPVGVIAGFFLARQLSGRFAFWVRFAADVLSGVPSIVVGVVAYELIVVPMKGFSALSGALALALIMIPTVVRTTEEMVKLVPYTLYEAALAVGAPEWRATVFVFLRGARAGIITGIMLAMARIAGETAPLLFTAFNNQFWSVSLTQPISSLPVQIFNYAMSPYDEWHRLAWAACLVLVVLVLGMSVITRMVTRGKYEIIQ